MVEAQHMPDLVLDHREQVYSAAGGTAGLCGEERLGVSRLELVVARRAGVNEPFIAGSGRVELNRRTAGASEHSTRKIRDAEAQLMQPQRDVVALIRGEPARDRDVGDGQDIIVAEHTTSIG